MFNKEKLTDYIWVEGYKRTDKNMICKGNSPYTYFQKYDLGKEYAIESEPILCENGFHFCLNLKDLFMYYKYNFVDHYFKVKGLVKKEHYDEYLKWEAHKLAAKNIILLEELDLDYETVKNNGGIKLFKNDKYKYEFTNEDFNELKYNRKNDYLRDYFEDKFLREMKEYGYSESLARMCLDSYIEDDKGIPNLMHTLHCAKAFIEEDLPRDLAVSILMKEYI